MEKDNRRAQGQWRGCYAFDNIIYDGDGSSSSGRNGGLKMGHTYWYYYKVDGDVETYDTSLPSTTSCPILPGQPVNKMSVPVENVPLRDRSASVGSMPDPPKTLNPDAKYETPRRPPPTPKLTRLNTYAGCEGYLRKRQNGPETPKSSRFPWSPRALFGPKSPGSPSTSSPVREHRQNSLEGNPNISYPILISRTDEGRKCVSLQEMREQRQAAKGRISPGHRPAVPELDISALDVVDDDDDENFAIAPARKTGHESQFATTILSPPPGRLNSLESSDSSEHTPTLRMLTAKKDAGSRSPSRSPSPDRDSSTFASNSSFRPAPLRLTPPESQSRVSRTVLHIPSKDFTWNAKSHFSMDSLDEMLLGPLDDAHLDDAHLDESLSSTPTLSDHDALSGGTISPTDSRYSSGCASPASLNDEPEPATDSACRLTDIISGYQTHTSSPTRSEFHYNPMISEVSSRGFQGYSLPHAGAPATAKRDVTVVRAAEAAQIPSARGTFGGPLSDDAKQSCETLGGGLQGLLTELGYLGEAITDG